MRGVVGVDIDRCITAENIISYNTNINCGVCQSVCPAAKFHILHVEKVVCGSQVILAVVGIL